VRGKDKKAISNPIELPVSGWGFKALFYEPGTHNPKLETIFSLQLTILLLPPRQREAIPRFACKSSMA
jgi:hypothetical protein